MKTRLPILILCAGLSCSLVSCTSADGSMNKGLVGAASGGLIGSLINSSLFKKSNSNSSSSSSSSSGSSGTTGSSSSNSSFLDDNQGLITGAAAGYAAGAITEAMAKNEARQKYLDGYNKGRSDAIKELYWVKRDAERPGSDGNVQRRYYEVPVPEHITTDGVLVEPRKVIIEVVE